MANWLTQFKGTHGGLGLEPYTRARNAGYSASQIAAAFPGSGLPAMGWRAQAALSNDLQQTAQRAASASQASSAADSYRRQLDDYTARFSDLTNKYAGAMARQAELQSSVADWEGKWNKSQSDYEEAKRLADSYKEEAVSRQLSGLQSGTTVQGRQATPFSGIGGGATAVSRQTDDKESAFSIEKSIDAEDSVLSRKGPVVQTIGRAANSSAGGGTGRPSLAGGTRYYAGRFG